MDQYPPAPKQPSKLHALAFLEIGLFEIGFVAVVLLLIFGTLNYFNILPVSEVFPNQLGWLPRQQTKLASQGQTLRGSDNLAKSNASPSPANFSPAQEKVPTGTFQYDTAKAKTLLTEYIKSTLKPEFIPSDLEKTTINQLGQSPNFFNYSFTTPAARFSAFLRYEKGSNVNNSFSISIFLKGELPTAPTTTQINSLISSYFVDPYVISNCKQDADLTSCENFQTDSEGKRGYGINAFGKINILYICQIPKESSSYFTAKSCASF